ncbi:hypothetical protein Acr_13g0016950 [Actinidia rufa]|uniref:Uncharacterized protein n=1 Tax=Actinidia rufa TaxID=165716 RepID=A0A7J0FNL3_9ERIC|nr:hypothetical protein Acr_13g0016950 [Actinidia rufa]
MHSIFFMCKCLGRLRDERGGYGDYPILEALPVIEDDVVARDLSEISDSGFEDDSVDERAERFIERFYEEMRIQRQSH